MPMKCEYCGHIHWDDRPVLKETYRYLRFHRSVTTRDVANYFDITVQNANNRLSQIEGLGACSSIRVSQESGGYIRKYVIKESVHTV